MKKKNKNGQSEMVGFVLIVVVVVIAAMIFLLISVKKNSGDIQDSLEVENLISAVLSCTTDCAIVYEPNYDSIEDLIVSCAENDVCSNLDRNACDVLNETLFNLMGDLIRTESQISAYQIDVLEKDGESFTNLIPMVFNGNCPSGALGAQKIIPSYYSKDLVFRVYICKD